MNYSILILVFAIILSCGKFEEIEAQYTEENYAEERFTLEEALAIQKVRMESASVGGIKDDGCSPYIDPSNFLYQMVIIGTLFGVSAVVLFVKSRSGKYNVMNEDHIKKFI